MACQDITDVSEVEYSQTVEQGVSEPEYCQLMEQPSSNRSKQRPNPALRKYERLETTFKDFSNMAHGRAVAVEAALAHMQGAIQGKADYAVVKGMHHEIQNLCVAMEHKPGSNEVPTCQAFQELKDAVASKADINEVAEAMLSKANVNEVPTNFAFQELASALEAKAQVIADAVATKASTNEVPTYRELRELRDSMATMKQHQEKASMTRLMKSVLIIFICITVVAPMTISFLLYAKIANLELELEHLRMQLAVTVSSQEFKDVVATKANIGQVPSAIAFQGLMDVVATKANMKEVPTGAAFRELAGLVDAKANVTEVPTKAAFEKIADHMATKTKKWDMSHRTALKNLADLEATKASLSQVPTKVAFDELADTVAAKANVSEVPNSFFFSELKRAFDWLQQHHCIDQDAKGGLYKHC